MKVLDNEHYYIATLTPKTAAGHPARVDGVPVWTTSDPAAFTLEVEPDGLSAKVITVDTGANVVTAKLKVTADADLGAGVKTITVEEDIVVGPAEAESLAFSFGGALLK